MNQVLVSRRSRRIGSRTTPVTSSFMQEVLLRLQTIIKTTRLVATIMAQVIPLRTIRTTQVIATFTEGLLLRTVKITQATTFMQVQVHIVIKTTQATIVSRTEEEQLFGGRHEGRTLEEN